MDRSLYFLWNDKCIATQLVIALFTYPIKPDNYEPQLQHTNAFPTPDVCRQAAAVLHIPVPIPCGSSTSLRGRSQEQLKLPLCRHMHQRNPPYFLRNATSIDTHHTPSTQLLFAMFACLRYPTQLYGKGLISSLRTRLKRPVQIPKQQVSTLRTSCDTHLMPHTIHPKPRLLHSANMSPPTVSANH